MNTVNSESERRPCEYDATAPGASTAKVVQHVFLCSVTGAAAATVTLEESLPGSGNRLAVLTLSGFLGISWFYPRTKEQIELLRALILAGDARGLYQQDIEYAPFYCPECDQCYAIEQWDSETYNDEELAGSHDMTSGRCPQGHGHLLDD